jgi:hypothetical protein
MAMKQIFLKYIDTFFKKLIDTGFTVKDEFNDGQSYFIEFSSKTFVIKIEKYFREFYTTIYRLDNPQKEINLFNLLDYLNRDDESKSTRASFHKEKDIEECYRKQLHEISTLIYDNYKAIDDFFMGENYESRSTDLRNYVINKYPELFKIT